MDQRDVRSYWNANADAWTTLARAGYDVYRDLINTPTFFELLPDVAGLRVLDIGCGEGRNTRLLAERGAAAVVACDFADRFVHHARAEERADPRGIAYAVASAIELPFRDESFDAAAAFMVLMDVSEPEHALAEAFRVLRRGGFFQFSITHPCFDTPHRRNVRDARGQKVAVELADYFRKLDGVIEEWLFGAAPPDAKAGLPPFRIPRFTRPLADWLNSCLDAGFTIERFAEPYASDEVVRRHPRMERARVVADFLQVRLRKP